jgi:hydrogenase expression/formation protein HypD
MKYVDEFRDAELGRALAGEILSIVEPGRHYKVMCSTRPRSRRRC